MVCGGKTMPFGTELHEFIRENPRRSTSCSLMKNGEACKSLKSGAMAPHSMAPSALGPAVIH